MRCGKRQWEQNNKVELCSEMNGKLLNNKCVISTYADGGEPITRQQCEDFGELYSDGSQFISKCIIDAAQCEQYNGTTENNVCYVDQVTNCNEIGQLDNKCIITFAS